MVSKSFENTTAADALLARVMQAIERSDVFRISDDADLVRRKCRGQKSGTESLPESYTQPVTARDLQIRERRWISDRAGAPVNQGSNPVGVAIGMMLMSPLSRRKPTQRSSGETATQPRLPLSRASMKLTSRAFSTCHTCRPAPGS